MVSFLKNSERKYACKFCDEHSCCSTCHYSNSMGDLLPYVLRKEYDPRNASPDYAGGCLLSLAFCVDTCQALTGLSVHSVWSVHFNLTCSTSCSSTVQAPLTGQGHMDAALIVWITCATIACIKTPSVTGRLFVNSPAANWGNVIWLNCGLPSPLRHTNPSLGHLISGGVRGFSVIL